MGDITVIGPDPDRMTDERADYEMLSTVSQKPNGLIMLNIGILDPDELQQAFIRCLKNDWLRFIDIVWASQPPQNEPIQMRVYTITAEGAARLRAMRAKLS